MSRILHGLSESGLIAVKGKQITVLDVVRLSQFDDMARLSCAKGG